MRILDNKRSTRLETIILYLTVEEAGDLKLVIDDLLASSKTRGRHFHIADTDYSHEIAVCLYKPGEYEGFDQRSKTLIEKDE